MEIIYRISGDQYWDTAAACFMATPENGRPVVPLYRNGTLADHDYLRRTLEFYGLPVGPELLTLEELKSSKLADINAAYDTATSALVSTYPQTELLTFDKQEAEARAWEADNAAETPLVDMLAAGRQMDKTELVSRIIAKADAFALAAGYLTGQRQRYEDMLAAAQTAEDVAAIVPEYILPQGISL